MHLIYLTLIYLTNTSFQKQIMCTQHKTIQTIHIDRLGNPGRHLFIPITQRFNDTGIAHPRRHCGIHRRRFNLHLSHGHCFRAIVQQRQISIAIRLEGEGGPAAILRHQGGIRRGAAHVPIGHSQYHLLHHFGIFQSRRRSTRQKRQRDALHVRRGVLGSLSL